MNQCHIDASIWREKLVIELTCKRCGGTHGALDVCPEAPGFLDYLGGWFRGERSVMNYLAISGLTLVFVLGTLVVVAAVRG